MKQINPKLYTSGNARLIGRPVHDQSWQQTLEKLDQELSGWPRLSLANQDILFEWNNDGLWLYREVIGYLTPSVLDEHGLVARDILNAPVAAWQSELTWNCEISDAKAWAEVILNSIQHIEFPDKYGKIDSWRLRLSIAFDGADKATLDWALEVLFLHGTSSIFAF